MTAYLANPYVSSAFSRFTTTVADGADVSLDSLEIPESGPCADYDWSGVAVIVQTHAAHPAGNYVEVTRFSNSCFCPTAIATSEGTSSTWMIADHCGLYGAGEEFGGDQVRLRAPDGTDVELAVIDVYQVGAIHLLKVDAIPSAFPRYKLVTNSSEFGGCGYWTCKHDGTGQFYYLADPFTTTIQSSGGVATSPITTELMASSGRPLFVPLTDGTLAMLGTQGPSSTTIRHYGSGANSVSVAALEAVMGGVTITTVQPQPLYAGGTRATQITRCPVRPPT